MPSCTGGSDDGDDGDDGDANEAHSHTTDVHDRAPQRNATHNRRDAPGKRVCFSSNDGE